ncbi:XRE family transcriptional regulator [Streptomyces calidiresistens]|uniref:XRE family transcriptional regulator n=1 Tax=Streptomyces calidiresistens TaxID=1485586 RepID=A0A7W3T5I0_9ACTN|nr:XRE family transcriptional regulator [Streptomyces calidiresistens]
MANDGRGDPTAPTAQVGVEISRRQSGATPWTLADLDALAAHYGIPVPDLLCGVDHALSRLPAHRRAATLGGTRATITTSRPGRGEQ